MLAWIIAMIFILLIVLALWMWMSFIPKNDFGTFSDPIVGPCINASGLCTEPSEQLITQLCIPNPQNGKGCLLDNGTQTYDSKVTKAPCVQVCQTSIWEMLEEGPCTLLDDTIPEDSQEIQATTLAPGQCVEAGTAGTKETKFICKAHDTTGSNACTITELQEIIGPTGISGNTHLLSTYNIGDEITVTMNCDNFPNPICGTWELVTPLDRDPTVPIGEGEGDQVVECEFEPNYQVLDECTTNENGDTWFDLKEGFQNFPMACVLNDELAQIPGDPTKCPVLIPPACSNKGLTVNQVLNGTLELTENPFNPLKCADTFLSGGGVATNREDFPICVRMCRLNQITTNTGTTLDPFLGGFLLFRINPLGYISVLHTPNTTGLGTVGSARDDTPLDDARADPEDNLKPVPIILIKDSESMRPGCTAEQLEFNTSLLFIVAPRKKIDAKTLEIQMGLLIGSDYQGWLSVDSGNGLWVQNEIGYKFNGINSSQAQRFRLKNDGGVFSIRTLANQSIKIKDLDGNNFTLDNLTAKFFPQGFQIQSRGNRCPGNCNLLYDPDGTIGDPNCL